jgi:hypothetical protein
VNGMGRRWRALRRRRDRAGRAGGRAALARAVERRDRVALVTPVDLVCTPESWARILRLTTFPVPDSDWIASPLRDRVERPRPDGLVAVELDARSYLSLMTDMQVDADLARHRYSPEDAAFVHRVYRRLSERVDAADPRARRPDGALVLDPAPESA